MKLLIITPYPYGEAPSQRFRFEQYLDTLEHKGFQITQHSFLSKEGWKILYKDGKNLSKAIHILNGFLRRLFSLASIAQYDFILIHREASPVGPPVFEWAIAKIFRKKIIYDFDDAIWLKDPSETGLKALVKWKSKVASICQWSYTVSCGNEYLANFARHYNNNVILNPTTIDTKNVHIPHSRPENALPVVGWTGTHSTMPYLEIILPVLKKLQQKIPFKFLIISNKPPGFQLDTMEYILWSKTTEIEDLNHIDIGIMPLYDDLWSAGKCGFKALQYLALSKPALVSPVGVNSKIINHGTNGFICTNNHDWEHYLKILLQDPKLTRNMGIAGRKFVEDHYSVNSNEDNFLSLFE